MDAGIRQQRAAATREQLIAAGLSLAERTGLSGMSVNQIVAEAGVAKGQGSAVRPRAQGG
jgi:AcrR family transcriptional regulator